MKKKKKLINRILCFIIPLMIVVLGIGETVCCLYSKKIVNREIVHNMDLKLENINKDLEYNITDVVKTAKTISEFISRTYKVTPPDELAKLIGGSISNSKVISGAGVWFEPNTYVPGQKNVCAYISKDGDNLAMDNRYLNGQYDYFSTEWYKMAKDNKDVSYFLSPIYLDEVSKQYKTTCSVPVYDEHNKVLGVVSVDISLDNLNQYISSIKVSNKGILSVVDENGKYVCTKDSDKILKKSIKDKSEGYGDTADKILKATKSGDIEGSTYNYYYEKFKGIDWTVIIKAPTSEINKDINKLGIFFVAFSVIIIALLTLVIGWLIKKISNEITDVNNFAYKLSDGDFSVDEIKQNRNDEIGQMCDSLNSVLNNNKTVIKNIAEHSSNISDSSDLLINTVDELKDNYESIEESIKNINMEMMNSSAATEEVNASAEEVNGATTLLTEETNKSCELALEIKEKANGIQKDSKDSYDNAIELSKKYEENLTGSIENAKIIDAINEMAETISNIAEQISLLSLNASIEAARAGENGKGFAVVAEEIGKLANETADSVNSIKNTIGEVQGVVEQLTSDSGDIIGFIKDTVTPDYNKFINIAVEYENDTAQFEEIFKKISNMTNDIEQVMNEVSRAIVNISESSQSTAENSDLIIEKVNNLSESVKQVETKVTDEKQIVKELNEIVNKFKL